MTDRSTSYFSRGLVMCGLLAGVAAGCGSVRTDEALAMLDVSAAADLPPFTTVRFWVAGRPEISPHEVAYDGGQAALKFGYYLPGPNGTLRITGQAQWASCPVGAGSAEVDVRLGQVSPSVALVLAPLVDIDSTCLASQDAAADAPAPADGRADAPSDAPTDTHSDTSSPPPPPPDASALACMAATKKCPGASACCSGLTCGTTTLGQVCCGNFGMTCSQPGGEDCCGQLECVNGGCCLPATYACQGSSCCAGLVCGNTTLGRVCCGNAGAPCKRRDGADCCGALLCVNGVCRT
jgi:hypothetical protein